MNKEEIILFFDNVAENWDAQMIKSDEKIERILDVAEVTAEKVILDVGCGTGVLIPYYLKRNVEKCVGVDISPKMAEIVRKKFKNNKNVEILCADAESYQFEENFDSIIIYNAFPHFVSFQKLFKNLSDCLNENGRITIAHGMSRNDIINCHSGSAEKVSQILPRVEEAAKIMAPFFDVDIKISTEDIYIVSGTKTK